MKDHVVNPNKKKAADPEELRVLYFYYIKINKK